MSPVTGLLNTITVLWSRLKKPKLSGVSTQNTWQLLYTFLWEGLVSFPKCEEGACVFSSEAVSWAFLQRYDPSVSCYLILRSWLSTLSMTTSNSRLVSPLRHLRRCSEVHSGRGNFHTSLLSIQVKTCSSLSQWCTRPSQGPFHQTPYTNRCL